MGVFPFMISALIYRNIDRMKANELMMIGEPIDAGEAARLNIVNAVVPAAEFEHGRPRLGAQGGSEVAAADANGEGRHQCDA